MILLRKKDLLIENKQHFGVCGFFTLETVDPKTKEVKNSQTFPNLVLNTGLDRMGISSTIDTYCFAGFGGTPPENIDTTMEDIASANSFSTTIISSSLQTTPPYYLFRRKRFTFSVGVVVGHVREVGIGWTSTGENLFSRAITVDRYGNPRPFVVLADEEFRVTYERRIYPNTVDYLFDAVIIGETNHCVSRPLALIYHDNNPANWGWSMEFSAATYQTAVRTLERDPALGEITESSTTGSYLSGGTTTLGAYTTGSFYRNAEVYLSNASNNASFNLLRMMFGWGPTQISFNSTIEKTSNLEIWFNTRISWNRMVVV